ncbi:MAG: dTDP-glucose 4,6-dehydratase [Acidimicrobiia bacterium]
MGETGANGARGPFRWSRLAASAARIRGDIPLVVLDAFLAALTYFSLFALRFDLDVPDRYWDRFEQFLPVAVVLTLVVTALWGGYGRTWQHASIDEARRVALTAPTVAVVLIPVFGRGDPNVPLLVLVIGPVVVMVLQGLVRFQSRLFAFRRNRQSGEHGLRVAIVGAGANGAAAVREMVSNPHGGLVPVVLLDDDQRLWRRRMFGVPVAGGIDELPRVVGAFDVHQVLLAIPNHPEVARRVADSVADTDMVVRVLPPLSAWVDGHRSLRDVRDLGIEDLLGRAQVHLDPEPVRELIRGRRVLVTGAGGSIGSVIAKQVAALEPERLVLLDHDETHLHDAAEGLHGRYETVLADVRDPIVVDRVFTRARPDIVFHAAAHKHVPVLERFACEAVRTNVLGTLNVVEAARRTKVTHLVAISTDKAADPTSVMGASKWLAEQVVLNRAPGGLRYCAVRFGNVLGSRGSVIPTFQRQIVAGGPVTVTDPRMTRWFMSTDEAVRLVLQAAANPDRHSVLALQMGEQVNVYELAERMIRLVGRRPGIDIEIAITGMRPGEKLSEALVGPGETVEGTGPILGINPVVMSPTDLDRAVARLASIADALDDEGARAALLELASPAHGVAPPRPAHPAAG